MSSYNKVVFDRPDTIGSWICITDAEMKDIVKVLIGCNYANVGAFIVEGNSDVTQFIEHTIRSPGENFTHIALIEEQDGAGYGGYLLARHGDIFDLGVLPKYANTKMKERLVRDFVKAKVTKHDTLRVSLSSVRPADIQLFTSFGFTFVEKRDMFSPSLSTWVGTLPGNVDRHEQLLDKNTGYIDFRGDYAVVDGHWTLKELESLLVLARRELTNAE